ncbi:hypothetical protein BT69DRAFT_1295325 [Atractiella rhizophila]|nr:hypothetical protein BT69DRAFT_1295325 [Atractiella rhizophila]
MALLVLTFAGKSTKIKGPHFHHVHADIIIIEFPASTVELDGLPKGYFPLKPNTWTFRKSIHNTATNKRDIRCFAILHKGKPSQINASLRAGGFSAYVAASRPRTHEGLALLESVTKDDLNKPDFSPYFKSEQRHLDALRRTTLLQCNGLDAPNSAPDIHDPDSVGLSKGRTLKMFAIQIKQQGQLLSI